MNWYNPHKHKTEYAFTVKLLSHSNRSLSFFTSQDVQAAKIFADECANILERSINGVLNRNALLYFAYADFEEGRLKYEKVHSMYNKLLTLPDIDPTLVRRRNCGGWRWSIVHFFIVYQS